MMQGRCEVTEIQARAPAPNAFIAERALHLRLREIVPLRFW